MTSVVRVLPLINCLAVAWLAGATAADERRGWDATLYRTSRDGLDDGDHWQTITKAEDHIIEDSRSTTVYKQLDVEKAPDQYWPAAPRDENGDKVYEDFFARFEGFLKVPKRGKYKFYLDSDDGSQLFIEDELLIENDGIHGAKIKKESKLLLEGIHPIMVKYYQGPTYTKLKLSWKWFDEGTSPGTLSEKQLVDKRWVRLQVPSPTPSPTSSGTTTPSSTRSPTQTQTRTSTATASITASPTHSESCTRTPTASMTGTQTPTLTSTNSPSHTSTPTQTNTPSISVTVSPTSSRSSTSTGTPTQTNTPSISVTVSPTSSRSSTPTGTATRSATPSMSPSLTETVTASVTCSGSSSATTTVSNSPTPSISTSVTGTATASLTSSSTVTVSLTTTPTSPASMSASVTSSVIQDRAEAAVTDAGAAPFQQAAKATFPPLLAALLGVFFPPCL
eukprot:gb/GECG01006924.1/.p1 GENE.gb/GECG01006924.1/~~gb/GECG01006924.1/.p1  ORF type:complete len:449 (+),score=44.90 gb/GECG01006924.1/:1-1347(+)